MHDRGQDNGRSVTRCGDQISESGKTGGYLRRRGYGADVQGIDHRLVGARSPEVDLGAKRPRGYDVQPSEHLQWGALPGLHLCGDLGRHVKGSGHGTAERGVVDTGAQGVHRHLRAFESRTVSRSSYGGITGHLGGTRANRPVPQERIDLIASSGTRVGDSGQAGEHGEEIAQ